MPVAIKGTGGGSVTLSAGTASADTTLTLPNTTGTVALVDGGGNQTVSGNLTVNGTSTLTGNVTTAGTVAMASSFKRNRIINGNMAVAQRATTATGNYSFSYTYVSVDRWAIYSANSSTTFGQSTSVPAGFQYSTKMQRPSGSTATGVLLMGQGIESVNCYDLSSQSVTLSFWAKAGANFSATGSVIAANVATGTVADQGISGVNTWAGLATPITTTSLAITTAWTKYTFTGTFGAGVLEAAIQFSYTPTGTAGADDAVYITGVQLEVGTIATPYERQIYSDQLAQCQRYCQIAPYPFTVPNYARTTTQVFANYAYPVTMRAAPTASFTTANWALVSGGLFLTPSALTADTSGVQTFQFYATVASTTVGFGGNTYTTSASGFVLSAEL